MTPAAIIATPTMKTLAIVDMTTLIKATIPVSSSSAPNAIIQAHFARSGACSRPANALSGEA